MPQTPGTPPRPIVDEIKEYFLGVEQLRESGNILSEDPGTGGPYYAPRRLHGAIGRRSAGQQTVSWAAMEGRLTTAAFRRAPCQEYVSPSRQDHQRKGNWKW